MKSTSLSLGERIAKLRELRGWSQEDLAAESGVPRRTLQNIEYGSVVPRIDNLLAISQALGSTVDSLTGQDVSPADAAGKLSPQTLAAQSLGLEHGSDLLGRLAAIKRDPRQRRRLKMILMLIYGDPAYLEDAPDLLRAVRFALGDKSQK